MWLGPVSRSPTEPLRDLGLVTALSERDLPSGESTVSLPGLFWAWDELMNAFKVLTHGESLTYTCSGLFYSARSDPNFRDFLTCVVPTHTSIAPRACQAPAGSPRAPVEWGTVSAWGPAGLCRTRGHCQYVVCCVTPTFFSYD